ncbi:hypothetical protein [Streptomyces sp. NPDC004589]|uniref:hypothetical protein n=1 Tax=Streptomyces sp. NPDC004589 TaxID=3154553 RepID=UPI0033BB5AFE
MSPLTITWTLRHHGWAFCRVADDQSEAEVVASYVTGGPEQFLNAITRLALTDEETRAEFEGEPQVYRWLFHREGAGVEIRLLRVGNFSKPDSSGVVLWSSHQTVTALARAALRAFDQVAEELGEEGYASQWGRPYPRTELEALRIALRALVKGAPSPDTNA